MALRTAAISDLTIVYVFPVSMIWLYLCWQMTMTKVLCLTVIILSVAGAATSSDPSTAQVLTIFIVDIRTSLKVLVLVFD